MSTHRTRCPSSANAAARLSVVVVLATPPFWLANAMTLALSCTVAPMLGCWKAVRWVFAWSAAIPAWPAAIPAWQLRSEHERARRREHAHPAEPARATKGQAGTDLRRRGRRGQDNDLGGARTRPGRTRAQGGSGDNRPRQAACERARPGAAVRRAQPDRPAGICSAERGDGRRAVGDDARRQAHVG